MSKPKQVVFRLDLELVKAIDHIAVERDEFRGEAVAWLVGEGIARFIETRPDLLQYETVAVVVAQHKEPHA